MPYKRRRILNVRIFVVTALSLTVSALYAYAITARGISGIYLLVPFTLALAAFLAVLCFKGFCTGAFMCLVAAVFMLVGALSAYYGYLGYCNAEVQEGAVAELIGSVEEVGTTSSGRLYLILTRASFGGTRLGGKVIVYLDENAGDYCRDGYTVSLAASIMKEQFFSDGQVGYRAVSGIKYYCTAQGALDATYAFSLTAEIRHAMHDALYAHMDGNTAAVVYAMLTGDSSGMGDATLTSFRYGGIAHIFAVSGLHIGVIFAAVKVALRRFGNRISSPVSIALIVFYSAVCSFTPSSVRATVMCAVSTVAPLFGRRYDSLNGAALAATLLLLMNPLNLYDKGFILSFSAVAGIIFLKYPLGRLLSFAPRPLANALSVSLSAQIGCFAGLMSSFGYVSAAGILLNVAVLPVLSAYYVAAFGATLLCCIFPFTGAVLHIIGVPLSAFINLMTATGFETAIISGWDGTLTYAACACVFVAATDKFNISVWVRSAAYIAAAIFLTLAVVLVQAGSLAAAPPYFICSDETVAFDACLISRGVPCESGIFCSLKSHTSALSYTFAAVSVV